MNLEQRSIKGNVWIFDLDGTLWEENSHVCIVEKYLRKKKYTNLLSRVWCRLSFSSYMNALDKDYQEMPKEAIKKFNPTIVKKTDEMIKAALSRKEQVMILSSAPNEIVNEAARIFGVPAYHADIGKKSEVLKNLTNQLNQIVVVTDNLSDKDLIALSNRTFFRVTRTRNKRKLKQYQDKIVFLEK